MKNIAVGLVLGLLASAAIAVIADPIDPHPGAQGWSLEGPANGGETVTMSSSDIELTKVSRGIRNPGTSAANFVVRTTDGSEVEYTNVQPGVTEPVRATDLLTDGTSDQDWEIKW